MLTRLVTWLRARQQERRRSLERMVRLRRMRWVRAECWKAADLLTWLGQENGEPQTHINDAKDALYRAVLSIEEREAAESNDGAVRQSRAGGTP